MPQDDSAARADRARGQGDSVTDDLRRTGSHQDRFLGEQDLTTWRTRLGRFLVRCVRRLARWLGPHAAVLVPLVVGLGVAVTMTVASAEVYEAVMDQDDAAALDRPLLQAAMTVRSPWLDTLVTAYTHVGGVIGMPILAAVAMVWLALSRRSWTPVLLVTVAAAGSLLMTVAGKPLIGRARPDLADAIPPYEYSASFPSGHSLNSFVIAGTVAYLLVLRQRTRVARGLTVAAAAAFAVSMALSRVYLGHHWFTDVLVAQTLGAAWLALVITAHRLHLTVRRRGPASLDS
ncbi:phosphatase PAP2 family protein [Kocuria oceani]|uniref:Phosphatase PAP2 family protein n=1 Tax=Kocuria oceani TaxID=988827 RepID=A0ABV9TI41_9MICC